MDRMAGALHSLGVRKGDRVGVFAHNGLDYLLGHVRAPGGSAPSRRWSTSSSRTSSTITVADHTPKVVDLHPRHAWRPVPRACRRGEPSSISSAWTGRRRARTRCPSCSAADLPPPPDPWDENAIAHLSYTSGTTGQPKGACLAHEPTVRACRCIAERLRIGPDDVSFGPTALSSSYQLVGNLLPPLARGASIHVMGRWTQATGWDALDARRRDDARRQSDAARRGAGREPRRGGRTPGRLRFALTGGGPLPPTLKAAWRDELGFRIVESYGQSELGGFVALGLPELVPGGRGPDRAIGPPPPDKEVRIVGPDDRPLPPGEIGEIVLRGGFMAGYWGKPGEDRGGDARRLAAHRRSRRDGRGRLRHPAQPPRRADHGGGDALVSARRRGGAVPQRRRAPGGADRRCPIPASVSDRPPSSPSTTGAGLDARRSRPRSPRSWPTISRRSRFGSSPSLPMTPTGQDLQGRALAGHRAAGAA